MDVEKPEHEARLRRVPSRFKPDLPCAIGVALALTAELLRRWPGPRLKYWLRAREGWPKWRLRLRLIVERKLRVILFALLAWGLVFVMRQVIWPSRSQLIALASAIATAWVVIEFLVRSRWSACCRR